MSGNEEFEPSRSLAHSSKQLTFQKLNSITWKATDGVQINTGAGRASRALGYVMEVFPGRWMARVGNLGSDLLSFGAAKQQAIRLYRCRDKGTMDWIHELNLRAAAEINRTALASNKRNTPVDLIGGQRHGLIDPKISAAVLEAEVGFLRDARPETIKGDDYPIEYHSDGYPELPVCLDRRRKAMSTSKKISRQGGPGPRTRTPKSRLKSNTSLAPPSHHQSYLRCYLRPILLSR